MKLYHRSLKFSPDCLKSGCAAKSSGTQKPRINRQTAASSGRYRDRAGDSRRLPPWTTPDGRKIPPHHAGRNQRLPYSSRRRTSAPASLDTRIQEINPNSRSGHRRSGRRAEAFRGIQKAGAEAALAVFRSQGRSWFHRGKGVVPRTSDPPARYATLESLMFQVSSIGPIPAKPIIFRSAAPSAVPYAIIAIPRK